MMNSYLEENLIGNLQTKLEGIIKYIQYEFHDINPTLNITIHQDLRINIPRQNDGVNCGVYMICLYWYFISCGKIMEHMTYDSDDIIDVQVQFAYLLLQGSDANLKSQTSNHLSHVSSGSSSSFGNSKLKLTKVNSNLFFVKQTVNSTIDTLQSVTKGRRQDDIKANSKQKKEEERMYM